MRDLASIGVLLLGLAASGESVRDWQLHVWEGSGWLGDGYGYVVDSAGRYAFYPNPRSLDFPQCRVLTEREANSMARNVRLAIDNLGEEGFKASGPCEDAGDVRVYINWRDVSGELRTLEIYLSECPSGVPDAARRLLNFVQQIHTQPSEECR